MNFIKVSVALAAYNGEKYIEEQISSILSELSANDEIIVSDDNPSSEMSKLVIDLSKKDSRIKYIEGPCMGVIKNFENALKHTSGDLIFLADQDDVWLPGKIKAVKSEVENGASLVMHDAKIVDENLNTINESFFELHKTGTGLTKNIVRNTYIGCCMAFTRDLLLKCLPFPEKIPMHDQYIALVAEKNKMKISLINDKYLLYRQHGNNVTGGKTSIMQKLIWRKNIISAIANAHDREFVPMDKIPVSAAIVTFNNGKYIEKAIKTLVDSVNYEKIDFKLFVFDNGSTDGTVELITERFVNNTDYCNKVKLIHSGGNIGFGAAHNQILEIMDAEFPSKYHCVVNPDIIIKDDIISKMVEYLENPKNSSVVQLSPRICFPDGRNQILGKRNPHFIYLFASRMRGEEPGFLLSRYAMLNKDYTKPFEIWNATGCFMFFRTDAFKKVGGFDKRYFMYFEDCDITREMRKLGKVLFFPDAVVYHVWARDSKRNTKLKIIHITSMLKYYLKWRTI